MPLWHKKVPQWHENVPWAGCSTVNLNPGHINVPPSDRSPSFLGNKLKIVSPFFTHKLFFFNTKSMDNKMIDLTNINDSKLDSQFDLESEGSSTEVLEVKTSEVSSNSTVPQ